MLVCLTHPTVSRFRTEPQPPYRLTVKRLYIRERWADCAVGWVKFACENFIYRETEY